MGLTDIQKLDLKFTTRTALLLKTCSEITTTIASATKTHEAQAGLNDVLTAKLLKLEGRIVLLESQQTGDSQ